MLNGIIVLSYIGFNIHQVILRKDWISIEILFTSTLYFFSIIVNFLLFDLFFLQPQTAQIVSMLGDISGALTLVFLLFFFDRRTYSHRIGYSAKLAYMFLTICISFLIMAVATKDFFIVGSLVQENRIVLHRHLLFRIFLGAGAAFFIYSFTSMLDFIHLGKPSWFVIEPKRQMYLLFIALIISQGLFSLIGGSQEFFLIAEIINSIVYILVASQILLIPNFIYLKQQNIRILFNQGEFGWGIYRLINNLPTKQVFSQQFLDNNGMDPTFEIGLVSATMTGFLCMNDSCGSMMLFSIPKYSQIIAITTSFFLTSDKEWNEYLLQFYIPYSYLGTITKLVDLHHIVYKWLNTIKDIEDDTLSEKLMKIIIKFW